MPNLALTASNAALTDDSSVISSASASTWASGFAFFMLASVSSNASSLRAVMTMPLAPASANASARPCADFGQHVRCELVELANNEHVSQFHDWRQ